MNNDNTWGPNKIRLLLKGTTRVTVTERTPEGKQHSYDTTVSGLTAYELRCKAFDGGAVDLILEPAQLEASARDIDNPITRAVVLLIGRVGTLEAFLDQDSNVVEFDLADHIASIMGSTRSGKAHVSDAIESISHGEHVRHSIQRTRQPVCWRCLVAAVENAGDECGCYRAPQQTGPVAYDPSNARDVATLTRGEREAEIQKLAKGQGRRTPYFMEPIPGQRTYIKRVMNYGLDPDEITKMHNEKWTPVA